MPDEFEPNLLNLSKSVLICNDYIAAVPLFFLLLWNLIPGVNGDRTVGRFTISFYGDQVLSIS